MVNFGFELKMGIKITTQNKLNDIVLQGAYGAIFTTTTVQTQ